MIAALSSVIGAVGLVVVVAAIVSNAAAASAAFASAGGDADNPRCGHSSSTDLVSINQCPQQPLAFPFYLVTYRLV